MQALNISEVGRRAFQAGLKASDNPFHLRSAARSWWAKGWRQARDEAANSAAYARGEIGAHELAHRNGQARRCA